MLSLTEFLCDLKALNIAKEIQVEIPEEILVTLEFFNRPAAHLDQILSSNWDLIVQALILARDRNLEKIDERKAALHLKKYLVVTEEDQVLLGLATVMSGLIKIAWRKFLTTQIYYTYRSAYLWLKNQSDSVEEMAILVDSRLEFNGKLDSTFQLVRECLLTDGEFGPWDIVHLAYDVKPGEKLVEYDEILMQGCSKLSQVYATLVSSGSFGNIVEIMDSFCKDSDCLLKCSPKLLTRFIAKENVK